MRLLLPAAGHYCLVSPLLEVGFLQGILYLRDSVEHTALALKMAGYWIFVWSFSNLDLSRLFAWVAHDNYWGKKIYPVVFQSRYGNCGIIAVLRHFFGVVSVATASLPPTLLLAFIKQGTSAPTRIQFLLQCFVRCCWEEGELGCEFRVRFSKTTLLSFNLVRRDVYFSLSTYEVLLSVPSYFLAQCHFCQTKGKEWCKPPGHEQIRTSRPFVVILIIWLACRYVWEGYVFLGKD